ncbi:hypothetical protein [Paraburkholderia sp. RL17-337-BIB-A]|uniref:hypothetical protein n=1 Tax=Paraburkholderia sp. RL17-337-BIB-A TaxID=3031636 RepID=UPI0038B97FB8
MEGSVPNEHPGDAHFERVGARELQVEELFDIVEPAQVPLLDPLVDELPYPKIAWQKFEKLCAHLLAESAELQITQAFQYGDSGDCQDEIDILARREGSDKLVMAQCKRVQTITPSLMVEWLTGFENSSSVPRCEIYILCVGTHVTKPSVLNVWSEFASRLEVQGVSVWLWDAAELDKRLRTFPGIVSRFFGLHYAERFCHSAYFADAFPSQFEKESEHIFDSQLTLQNQSIHAGINLPGERFTYCGAILSFARRDLTGVSFAVSGSELVEWMQWRNWAKDDDERPYARKSTVSAGKFVFAAGGVRLTLTSDEVEQLDWIIRKAWPRFLASADSLDRKWRFLRFPRLPDVEAGFSIIKASRETWSAMLQFARAHDYSKGTSEQHIFDASSGMLKVYVDHPRHGLRSGYHLLLRAFSEPGMTLPWEGRVILAWEAPLEKGGLASEIGPSGVWDAEFTHDWLLDVLGKWVEDWLGGQRESQPRLRLRPRRERPVFACDMWSIPILDRRDVGSFGTVKDLQECIRFYQSYFHVHRGAAQIPPGMISDVLLLVERHLKHADVDGAHFVAMKLHLDGDALASEIEALAKSGLRAGRFAVDLDIAFRCLLTLVENMPSLPRSELDHASDHLRTIASRVREDLLCAAFSVR